MARLVVNNLKLRTLARAQPFRRFWMIRFYANMGASSAKDRRIAFALTKLSQDISYDRLRDAGAHDADFGYVQATFSS